jgi:hypothetical protein
MTLEASKPSHPAYHCERNLLAWSLLAALIIFAAMAAPFFLGRIYSRNDLGAYHLPVRDFYARQLAKGESFDWMPQLFSGYFLTGDGQAGTYHPLHWMLYRWLPFQAALDLEWLLSYPFMLAGTWLFLRRRITGNSAAMLGSVFFSFSSFNLLHFIHPNAVAVVSHIPWLLWTIDIVLTDARRTKIYSALAAMALLTGSQLLLGYPQFVWFSLLTEFAYTIYVLIDRRYAPRTSGDKIYFRQKGVLGLVSSWPDLVLAKFIGLFLGGAQLLPTIDALFHSSRQSADTAFAVAGSLHPLNLLQLVAPYLFVDRVVGQNTHELGLYLGAVPLMLIVWLVIRGRDLGVLKSFALAVALFGATALLLAFGQYGRIYQLLTQLPLIGYFRFPARYVVIFQLATAILAAIGFLSLVRASRNERRKKSILLSFPNTRSIPLTAWSDFLPLWILASVSIAVAILGLVFCEPIYLAPFSLAIVGPALFIAAALLIYWSARGSYKALVSLILLAALDLGIYGLSYSVYPYCPKLDEYVAEVNTPPGQIDGRVVASLYRYNEPGLRTGDEMILRGWNRADGYAGLEPQRLLDYKKLQSLQVAGVHWVRHGPTTNNIQGLIPYDNDWFEVPNPLPRIRLVNRTTSSDNPAADIAKINIESEALTDMPLAFPAAKTGSALLIDDCPGRLIIKTEAPATQLLVVAESYHPGWKASVNESPAQIYRVNGDYMGCVVGSGTQIVHFHFQPASLRTGRMISCLGLGFLPFCFLGIWLKPSISNPEEPGL